MSIEKNTPIAYEGNEPYIFASYSHKDFERVAPILRSLQDAGFRIWFDGGIVCGMPFSNRPEERLRASSAMLVFLSEETMLSRNCCNEILFAHYDIGKSILPIYLRETVLPPNFALLLTALPTLFAYLEADDDALIAKIKRVDFLADCWDKKDGAPPSASEKGDSMNEESRQENRADNEKKRRLFERQRALLDTFLANGAITRAQYDKSLGDLIVKMGIEDAP